MVGIKAKGKKNVRVLTPFLSECQLQGFPSLGKRVQKYALFKYTPNLNHSFFELFLRIEAKVLNHKDVVEHIFFIMSGLRAKTVHMGYIIISHASA